MKSEIKQKWVDALRSGEYKQGTCVLRNVNEEFCCLGVLCDLYEKDHTDMKGWGSSNPDFIPFAGGTAIPPDFVVKWAGLDGALGNIVTINGNSAALAIQNDQGKTFAQIATAIEEQL